jgi:hypothetical protein
MESELGVVGAFDDRGLTLGSIRSGKYTRLTWVSIENSWKTHGKWR